MTAALLTVLLLGALGVLTAVFVAIMIVVTAVATLVGEALGWLRGPANDAAFLSDRPLVFDEDDRYEDDDESAVDEDAREPQTAVGS